MALPLKKNCCFQYAYEGVIVEDTGLIDIEEAKELWRKYLPDFIEKLQEGMSLDMVIWTEMKEDMIYHKELVSADWKTMTDGKRIFKKVEIIV